MLRTLSLFLAGASICVVGLFSADAQETKKQMKAEIPGGIEGHVKSVDAEKETVTIVTSGGTTRTFNVNEDTTMLGPRGGRVRRRLHDPRFQEGMELTVVASGSTAKELHLGYRHREGGKASEPAKTPAKAPASPSSKTAGSATTPTTGKSAKAAAKAAAPEDEDDEDDEIPGKVKSYNTDRHLLVVELLNGKSRAFLLARDLKVTVKGTASKKGVDDPAIKEGTHVVVFVEEGGRRVKELHVDPAPPRSRAKKAA